MKSNFKKIGLFLVLGLATAVFYSCDEENNGSKGGGDNGGSNVSKIAAANVINGSTQITTVKAIAYWESGNNYGYDAIAQTRYANNGFTLELPSTVAAKYLELIFEEAPQGVSVSDENAKMLFLDDLRGYDEDEKEIGDFYLEKENDNSEYYTSWFYVDRDVTIKGEVRDMYDDYEDIDKFDLTLKKGWNVIYDSYVRNYNSSTKNVYVYSLTSKKPSGVNYSWVFYDNEDYKSAQAPARSVENTKSVFSKLKENKKSRTRKQ